MFALHKYIYSLMNMIKKTELFYLLHFFFKLWSHVGSNMYFSEKCIQTLYNIQEHVTHPVLIRHFNQLIGWISCFPYSVAYRKDLIIRKCKNLKIVNFDPKWLLSPLSPKVLQQLWSHFVMHSHIYFPRKLQSSS